MQIDGVFFQPSLELQALAEEYHRRTEEYDRTVCTGPIRNGGIMPATSREHGLIEQNARNVFKELARRAAAIGIWRRQLHYAISNYRRYHDEEVCDRQV